MTSEEYEDMTIEEYTAACVFDCSCGEAYPTIGAAIHCRKCRRYTERGYCTEVVGPKGVEWRWPFNVDSQYVWEFMGMDSADGQRSMWEVMTTNHPINGGENAVHPIA